MPTAAFGANVATRRAVKPTLLVLLALPSVAVGCSGGGLERTDGGGDQRTEVQPTETDIAPPDGGNDTSPETRPIDSPASFIVHGQLTLTANGPAATINLPTTQDFTLRIDPNRGVFTIGGHAYAVQVGAATGDRATFEATAPVSAPLVTVPLCRSSASYAHFTITVAGDQLSGTADGTAEIVVGDEGFQYTAALAMTGQRDGTPPTLGADRADVDPLSDLVIDADEPVPSGATARLVAGAETVALAPVVATDGGGVIIGFHQGPGALRYGTTYQVTAIAGLTDLAGNAAGALPAIVTLAPPPLAAEDGFEGAAATVGGAVVVDATVLPPITGQRSVALVGRYGYPVALEGSRRLTVRLALAPGDTVVRFSVRPFSQFDTFASTSETSFRVFVPGGAIASANLPPGETIGTRVMVAGGSNTISFGAVRTVEIPLPAGASGDIVFDAATFIPSVDCGLAPPTVSYLLDDLRVE